MTATLRVVPVTTGPLELRAAAHAATHFLLRHEESPGSWTDFRLPVGVATDWVTAHVAGALAAGTAVGVRCRGAALALDRADERLGEPVAGIDGWGFNADAGPDADTTALATLFLSNRRRVPTRVVEFLASHRRPDGGYATYGGPAGWARSHPCVTPPVALALRSCGRPVTAQTLGYVRRSRRDDGTWPAYWWRGEHYATFWNLLLLRSLGCRIARRGPVLDGRESARILSTLDLACLVGVLFLRLGADDGTRRVAGLLLSRQRADGGFDGGSDLRVTHHDCLEPWADPVGQLYRDDRGLLTTAMVLRVLAVSLAGAPP